MGLSVAFDPQSGRLRSVSQGTVVAEITPDIGNRQEIVLAISNVSAGRLRVKAWSGATR